MLEGIGLTSEQEHVYRELVAHPDLAPEGLRAHCVGLSRQRLQAALRSLADLGLISQLPGTPARFEVIPPDIAIDSLARNRAAQADQARQRVPELMDLFLSSRAPSSADCIELLTTAEHIVTRFDQLESHATTEIRGFNCPPYLDQPHCDDEVQLGRLDEGIGYRIIYTARILDTPGSWASVERAMRAGEQSRMLETLPGKLIIFDVTAALISLAAGPDGVCMIVVHESPLLDLLATLFEQTWERAIPLSPDGPVAFGESPASSTEQQLISLLAAGVGDEAIARAMDVSLSTVQRRVRELMQRVGARSRFQAGLQIGRRSTASEPIAETVSRR